MTDVADMDLVDKIDFIKSTVSPTDVADLLGFEVVGGKIPSPWHPDERTPSCHLYDDHWFDYSSGNGGDVIDLAVKLTGRTWGSVINMLAKGAVGNDMEPGRVKRAVKEPPADMTETLRLLTESSLVPDTHVAGVDLHRLLGAGVIDFTSAGDMLIPHRSEVGVHGIKIRYRAGGKGAVPGSQFGHALYDPFKHLSLLESTWWSVVLTEGESDCWALHQQIGHQVDVMALPSGAGLWRDAWMAQLEPYRFVYTAFDNDRAGKQATEKVRQAVGWGRWKELPVPQLYNDVREAIAAGWRPKL